MKFYIQKEYLSKNVLIYKINLIMKVIKVITEILYRTSIKKFLNK